MTLHGFWVFPRGGGSRKTTNALQSVVVSWLVIMPSIWCQLWCKLEAAGCSQWTKRESKLRERFTVKGVS